MSKYTTQVRFICETKSGLDSSVGSSEVDYVIAESWNKIFTTNTSFFDENYRSVLCQKILKHYYLREICSETVGIWQLWMNTRLEEIMPYYNQLYDSAKLDIKPFDDVNLTRKHTTTIDGTTSEEGTRTENSSASSTLTGDRTTNITKGENTNTNSTTENNKTDLYSDTPQGGITGLKNNNYLTNARIIDDNTTNTENSETNGTESNKNNYTENDASTGEVNGHTNNTGTTNTTEEYIETIIGKQGTENYSNLLLKYRETFLNIDMLVIEEFNDLFFGLW